MSLLSMSVSILNVSSIYISYQMTKVFIKKNFLLCLYLFIIYWLFWIGFLIKTIFFTNEQIYESNSPSFFPLLGCLIGFAIGSIVGLWLHRNHGNNFFHKIFFMVTGSLLCAVINAIIIFTGNLTLYAIVSCSKFLIYTFFEIDYSASLTMVVVSSPLSVILNIAILIGISPAILKHITEYTKASDDSFFKVIISIPSYLKQANCFNNTPELTSQKSCKSGG